MGTYEWFLMSFQEVKGTLAKLLATEDLIIEHRQVSTASFDVGRRLLTLPIWNRASETVYDLLVAHEVGHALFTPNEDVWGVPMGFVNITEDVRIEKLMKRKYPGLPKTFYRGYSELQDDDFFSIADEDLDAMNLADRINLYFKIGSFVKIDFSAEEKKFVDQTAAAETFEEAVEAAKAIFLYMKSPEQEEVDTTESGQEGESDRINEEGQDSESNESTDDSDPQLDTPSYQSGDNSGDADEPNAKSGFEDDIEDELKTQDAFDEKLSGLCNDPSEYRYISRPKLNLDRLITNNDYIHRNIDSWWNQIQTETCFEEVDAFYNDFKKNAQKEVNYLVKEFEMRKSADAYARSSTARTGVLDCTKLHTYKYNEDLFKKVTTLADGKNHGLVFILDWSGSMGDVMLDTVKQLFNLVWFCKKVAIPFEVYAFTSDYPLVSYSEDGKANLRELAYTKKDGLVQVGEWFSLMNLLTSKTNSKTLEDQMRNIFRLANSFRWNSYTRYPTPYGMSLSGTPLNETMVALHQILPKFQKEHKLQKVQCVVLTDGEAAMPKYHREVQRRFEDEPFLGTCHIGPNAYLRDRKTGITYSLDCEWYQFTDVLLNNLRDKFKDINFIGIRVLESRDAGSFIRRYCGYLSAETDKTMAIWKKQRAFSLKNSGYHTYFGLSANALSQDADFEVAEDATKTQIKSAFAKSLKSKKMNKKILGEFVELVA